MAKIAKSKKKKIVYVGLSGGVDSSVSAALLKEASFDVRGVFIKVWQPHFAEASRGKPVCTATEDRLDAMRVCARLDIPFHTLDLEQEYKKEVVDYMIAEYRAGRTPNPDVMCNKYVKFGGFFDWAMSRGADYVATGHYAQVKQLRATSYELLAGEDKNKDQSYFLWTLTQKQLVRTLFPVGGLEKPEVRKLAKKFGLNTAVKKDSQGLCFIGKVEMAEFLKHFIKTKQGKVLDSEGRVIGQHDGAALYTLGQRHGFSIKAKSDQEEPFFVIRKDLAKNTLTVSHDPVLSGELGSREVKVKGLNWIAGAEPDLTKEYFARIRYRQPLEICRLDRQGSAWTVKFQKPQKAVTKGQSIVFYDGEVCLGGGIIS